MIVENTELSEVLEIFPVTHLDTRGRFLELYSRNTYDQITSSLNWLQDNLSYTKRGVIRGLHLQWPKGQGKLVSAIHGKVFDVAVDVRKGSKYFGRWIGRTLDSKKQNQLWIPSGFAHGFQALSDEAIVHYKCTENFWAPEDEICIRFDDPEIGIRWPLEIREISARDQAAPNLSDCKYLPQFQRGEL